MSSRPAGALGGIWRALTPAHRRRFVALQFVAVLMATSTVAGLAAVLAFFAVLADPTLIQTHEPLSALSRLLGAGERNFFLALGGAFIALLLLSACVNVLGSRAMGRFAYAVGDHIREALFARYLRRDYLFHARTGAAPLMDHVLFQADRVVVTLLHAQLLMTNAVLTLLVVVSIAIVNPFVALAGLLAVAGSYFLFYRVIRRRVARNGLRQTQLAAERIGIVEQAFAGIKYLLLAGAQRSFERRFTVATRTLSHLMADTQFIGQFPRYLLECAAGAALIGCALLVSRSGGAWLAQLSFIGFAGFRLLPAIQQMYNALVVVRAHRESIESLLAEIDGDAAADDPPVPADVPAPRGTLELTDVSFRYAPEGPSVLELVSLRIAPGATIGIAGASGSGKTTLVDVMLGLLVPSGGHIMVDGRPLAVQRPAWQRSIGYVPQLVALLDASVRENIAFGVDAAAIDDARVREAARQAGAAEFIEALSGGYGARVSGGSLSGGQRQRLGIARALYREPALLVLDEATGSLDAATERAIVDAVIRNRGGRTVVVVAHGGAAIDACDRVYELRNGVLRERAPPVSRAGHAHA